MQHAECLGDDVLGVLLGPQKDREAHELVMVTVEQAEATWGGDRRWGPGNLTRPGLWLNAAPVRMRQALGNLMSNALRHTPADSTVPVTARQTR